jgi:hypothetical protein
MKGVRETAPGHCHKYCLLKRAISFNKVMSIRVGGVPETSIYTISQNSSPTSSHFSELNEVHKNQVMESTSAREWSRKWRRAQ